MYPLKASVSWQWSSTHWSVWSWQIGQGPGGGGGFCFFNCLLNAACPRIQVLQRESRLSLLRGWSGNPIRGLFSLHIWHCLVAVGPASSDLELRVESTSKFNCWFNVFHCISSNFASLPCLARRNRKLNLVVDKTQRCVIDARFLEHLVNSY